MPLSGKIGAKARALVPLAHEERVLIGRHTRAGLFSPFVRYSSCLRTELARAGRGAAPIAEEVPMYRTTGAHSYHAGGVRGQKNSVSFDLGAYFGG